MIGRHSAPARRLSRLRSRSGLFSRFPGFGLPDSLVLVPRTWTLDVSLMLAVKAGADR